MSDIIPLDKIESKILLIRGQKVMLGRDLASLYGVETRELNQAVKRNIKRFPRDFVFQLSDLEMNTLVSQNVIPSIQILGGHSPYVFTEQGVAMLSSVLKSEKAIEVNVAIMRTFVKIRKFINSYEGLARKIAELEKRYDKKIGEIFKVLDYLVKESEVNNKDRKEIGFKA